MVLTVYTSKLIIKTKTVEKIQNIITEHAIKTESISKEYVSLSIKGSLQYIQELIKEIEKRIKRTK